MFILSGAEDLVPLVDEAGDVERPTRTVDDAYFEVVRYRPRIEGLYARIERWTARSTGEAHWRSISRDNVTTVYGRDGNSRVADPADPLRVFSWLICETYDSKGNTVVYRYAEEDDTGVDVAAAHERNRDPEARTTNRYLKSVRYGNRTSRLASPDDGPASGDGDRQADGTDEADEADGADGAWLFELVFDYGEHDDTTPTSTDDLPWLCRNDPFSNYRAGFEIRTYRLCQRILMFHHFSAEPEVGQDCLVRSMRLTYRDSRNVESDRRLGHPTGALLASVTVTGHDPARGTERSLPPLELTYSTASPSGEVHELEPGSLEGLPAAVDGAAYQWIDLDCESISGVLTVPAGAWFYKRNEGDGRLGVTERLVTEPSLPVGVGGGQLLDLGGDGRLDLVDLAGPVPGFFERVDDEGWAPHRPFRSLPAVDWSDPNLRFGDLSGDGHADAVVTRGDAVVWCPSLGEVGFGAALRVAVTTDEEAGPRVLFADGTESVHLADLSGDGLPDLARVRNGEVCYWPNLGYGRFGPKVTMDDAPLFDHPDRFDPSRVRLADLDGTGPIDLVYLGADGVDVYTNRMGNRWSGRRRLDGFPAIDDLTSVAIVDLLGSGTACLVWSSPLPGDAGRHLRYLDLMGTKPNLLVHVANNLGAETAVTYTTSTRCYLRDRAEDRPWLTRLPFPVHVVEKIETFDRISHNRFVTRYRYHDGYFDGQDREFRGFGMVEQDDTEHIGALGQERVFPRGANTGEAHHLPPVRTRTWFHTGAYVDRDRLSTLFADQYYPPPEHALADALAWLLEDTFLPVGLDADSERDACRALKGQMLRQEVYALDGTDLEPYPYTVVERNYGIRVLQAPAGERPGVFAVDPRETVTATCERHPQEARVTHEVMLAVDPFGTVLHSVALAYGRGTPDPALPERTRTVQATTLVTETRTQVTNLIDLPSPAKPDHTDAYRVPVPYDTATNQISGVDTDHAVDLDGARPRLAAAYLADTLTGPLPAGLTRRPVSRQRTRFHADDLSGPFDWGEHASRGLVHETYRLAVPEVLRTGVYGPRVTDAMLVAAGYVRIDGDDWWAPSGAVRYAPISEDSPAARLRYASRHFFLPRRFVDPFAAAEAASGGAEYATSVEYDAYDLLPVETIEPLGNRTTAGLRNADGSRAGLKVDYRVLAPSLVTDPNRNRTAVCFDALGMVTATAVMGKPEDDTGDRVDGLVPDATEAEQSAFWADPLGQARTRLGTASTRLIYDVDAYLDSRHAAQPQPVGVATIARERHVADPTAPGPSPLQVSFSYSDGTGQQIQQKLQAEPDRGSDPRPVRWVSSGWTVFNNKGLPVRRYEPFFTPRHTFEFAVAHGVGPVLVYDPPGLTVATLHPNRAYDKVIIGAWEQRTWDANDTAALPDPTGQPRGDPRDDPDIGRYARALPEFDDGDTWYRRRSDGQRGPHERTATQRTALHVATPSSTILDPLGRPVLVVARNLAPNESGPPTPTFHRTHSVLDIAGNQLQVLDCTDGGPGPTTVQDDRLVARYRYDLTGALLQEESMEAGTRRQLLAVDGNPAVVWEVVDDTGAERTLTTSYDRLRRPVTVVLKDGTTTATVERTVYGEGAQGAELANQRGRVRRSDDGAGTITISYDVAGNATTTERRLTAGSSYRDVVDWAANPALGDPLRGDALYDALNRPYQQAHHEGTVVRYRYNRAGLLDAINATIAPDHTVTDLVTAIDYNARGQRTRVAYGNGATTTYGYDDETFRLATLRTVRIGAAADEPTPPDTRRGVQNLTYTYDPVGNITHIVDTAQPRVFHLNTKVDADGEYIYDALYRLVEAHGREHLGLGGAQLAAPTPTSNTDATQVNPADRNALGRYQERYTYDLAGNLTQLTHHGTSPAHPGWVRSFTHREPSQLERHRPGTFSNRLTTSTTGQGANAVTLTYHHDARGNMTGLPPLELIGWDYRDQLQATATQRVGSGVPETTYYCYDATGQRVRWVRDSQADSVDKAVRIEERIYLGDIELYRTYDPGTGNVALARTTVHIMDGEQRVALIETRTDPGAAADPHRRLVRYQHANHLGSAVVELDATGEPISYEEFYPYGNTALLFWRAGAPPKRYRYTTKERDATGLYYYGARYYAPWLSRWTSCDPTGLRDGPNSYCYCHSNPTSQSDQDGRAGNYSREAEVVQRIVEILDSYNIPHSREVGYNITKGAPGFHDVVAGAGGRLQIEAKLSATSRFTPHQLVNHPLIESGHLQTVTRGGAEIGLKAGSPLPNNLVKVTGSTVNDEFLTILKENFPDKLGVKVEAKPPLVRRTLPSGEKVTFQASSNAAGSPSVAAQSSFSFSTPESNTPPKTTPAAVPAVVNSEASSPKPGPVTETIAAATTEASAPSRLAKLTSQARAYGAKALRVAGYVTTALGAHNQAVKSYEWGGGGILDYVNTFALGIVGGAVDDAIIVASGGAAAGPASESWDTSGAGPTQVLLGNAYRKGGELFNKYIGL